MPPDDYVATVGAAHAALNLRAHSERHLAAPKSSQLETELHGKFDTAIGSTDPATQRAAYGVALREAGTFLDTTVADLANPGQTLPQPGVALHNTPTADPSALKDLATLQRGEGLASGQYVVHDVDAVVLPYLPDPLAAGVSFVFPDAGRDHRLPWPFAIEGVTLPFPADWPEPVPWRLVLASGPTLGATTAGNEVRIALPPGERLRLRLSTCLRRDDLDLLGLWRSLPPVLTGAEVVAEAAADGWFWWLTPYEEIQLVHAVQRPVEAPRTTLLLPHRLADETAVKLIGGVDVHGPSTERLDVEASWDEWVDDVGAPAPERVHRDAAACGTAVSYDEDLVVLWLEDGSIPLPDGSAVALHAAVHQLGDTRHRVIDYRMRATTRWREFFPPEIAPTPADLSVVGEPRTVRVPSTARPARPQVRDVLPLFHWEEQTEPDQPFGLRRRRRPGLRIWLERPWFSSGDSELLALVLAAPGSAVTDLVSEWGGDPVWRGTAVQSRTALPLTDLLHATGLDDRSEPGRPVTRPTQLPLVDVEGATALVLGYQPEFHPARGLWAVDVLLDPGAAFWPFVRLAVARYQPDSLGGLALSPVVRTDFVQLAPDRIATLSRPDEAHARVVVTGPVGFTRLETRLPGEPTTIAQVVASRTMRARLERLDPAVGTDLGWVSEAALDLPLLGLDGFVASWTGTLPLPTPMPPRTPGTEPAWRITVEEWERLPADPIQLPIFGEIPLTQARMVYADHLAL